MRRLQAFMGSEEMQPRPVDPPPPPLVPDHVGLHVEGYTEIHVEEHVVGGAVAPKGR